MFVVCWTEHLRDGTDWGAKLVNTEAEGMAFINRLAGDSFGGDNTTFQLFHLGVEIPLVREVVEIPGPSTKTVQYKAKP